MRTALSLVFVLALSVQPAFAQSEAEIQEQAQKVNALNDALWALQHDDLESIAKNDPEAFAEAMGILEQQVQATQDGLTDKMNNNKCGSPKCPGHGKNTDACSKTFFGVFYHDNAKDLNDGRSNRHSNLDKARQMFAVAKQTAQNGNGSTAYWYYKDGAKTRVDLDNALQAVSDVFNAGLILSPPTGIGGAVKGAKVLKALSDLNSAAVDGMRKQVEKQRDEEQKKLKKMLKDQRKDVSATGITKILEEARKAKSEE